MSTAEKYFKFLGTQFLDDDGVRRQPAKGRFVDSLRELNESYRSKYDLSSCLAGTQKGFSGRVWFWSDQHFFHNNIINYCDRPFSTVDEMNQTLIDNCLKLVSSNDILIFGGDIAMQRVEDTNILLRKIPAYKINVLGNHDTGKHLRKNLAVDETAACLEFSHQGRKFFVSHYPMREDLLEPGQFNLHGHIHNTGLHQALGDGQRHLNMSVECIDYSPKMLSYFVK